MRSPTFGFGTRHCDLLLLFSLTGAEVRRSQARRDALDEAVLEDRQSNNSHLEFQNLHIQCAYAHRTYNSVKGNKGKFGIKWETEKALRSSRAAAQLCVQSPGSNSRTSGRLMVRVGIVLYSSSCFAPGRAFSLTNLPIALWGKTKRVLRKL